MVNNNLPVTPEMFIRRTTEWAWLKGVKVRVTPLMAGAYAELEPAMIRWREIKLAWLSG